MTDRDASKTGQPLVGWFDAAGKFIARLPNISGGIEQAVQPEWIPAYAVTGELLEAVTEVIAVAEESDGADGLCWCINQDAFQMLVDAADDMNNSRNGDAHG